MFAMVAAAVADIEIAVAEVMIAGTAPVAAEHTVVVA